MFIEWEKAEARCFSAEESAGVYTVLEAKALVRSLGLTEAAKKVRIITTGTFEPFEAANILFRVSELTQKMKFSALYLNEIPAYPTGLEGGGRLNGSLVHSENSQITGASIIEELVRDKKIRLNAVGHPSEAYPGKNSDFMVDRKMMKDAVLELFVEKELHPRGYWNSSKKTMLSELGILLPEGGSLNYAGSGELSPWTYLSKNEEQLCGVLIGGVWGQMKRAGEGWSLTTDLKAVQRNFLRAGAFGKQGGVLYLGIGLAFRIDGEASLEKYMVSNEEVLVEIEDIAIEAHGKMTNHKIPYSLLEKGTVILNGKNVRTAGTASMKISMEVAEMLKGMIQRGEDTLCQKQELR